MNPVGSQKTFNDQQEKQEKTTIFKQAEPYVERFLQEKFSVISSNEDLDEDLGDLSHVRKIQYAKDWLNGEYTSETWENGYTMAEAARFITEAYTLSPGTEDVPPFEEMLTAAGNVDNYQHDTELVRRTVEELRETYQPSENNEFTYNELPGLSRSQLDVNTATTYFNTPKNGIQDIESCIVFRDYDALQ